MDRHQSLNHSIRRTTCDFRARLRDADPREFPRGVRLLALLGAAAPDQAGQGADPIIDIHQHLNYSGRSDAALLAHQVAMGATTTILLPSGRPLSRPSTTRASRTASTRRRSATRPAGSLPELTAPRIASRPTRCPTSGSAGRDRAVPPPRRRNDCRTEIRCRVRFAGDAAHLRAGRERGVPVLMHWQFETYNKGFERFHRMLEKFPQVRFIGHAQTWWANIDRNHADQTVLYPKGR
jgi:hypothetical protein